MPFDQSHGAPQRIAIIGGGISGLAAARLLSRHHQITLYEAEPRLGGHARTVHAGRHGDRAVDTGFIVFNYSNYPHFTAMLRDLDVPVEKSDMSFGVSLNGGRLEYALRSADALFAQRRNLVIPGFYGMVRDIVRFNARAEAEMESAPGLTITDLLDRMRLGRRFREHYLFPICGAIWSTPSDVIGSFPAHALIGFLRNHALMSKGGAHQWWTISGGSAAYVSRLMASLLRHGVAIRPGTAVQSVKRDGIGVLLHAPGCEPERFDQVIFATHADQTLAMLADPSGQERAALAAVRFQANRALLHRDPQVMPRRRGCWSSWVYRGGPDETTGGGIGVSYWMNRLQNIPEDDPLFVTLNPRVVIPDEAVYDEVTFHHPVFDQAALVAQGQIAALQGQRGTWFAGAWLRNGFHEDGFASAVRIARQLVPKRAVP